MFFVDLQAAEAEFQSGQYTQVPILQKIHPALPVSRACNIGITSL